MSMNHGRLYRAYCMAIICLPLSIPALTRWSTLHLIPDADFLESWNYIAEYQGYYFSNEAEGASFASSGLAHLAVGEWVDVHAGYAGGVTLGLKAKLLGEATPLFPSLAIGARNVMHHREDHYYHHDSACWKHEFFAVLGKSVQPIRLRLHLGIQTMLGVDAEKLGYFFGLEKFLGGGVYVTLETVYRDKKLRPSLFTTVRAFRQRVEVSVGAVDLASMFFDADGAYSVSFSAPRPQIGRVRPGLWLGLRFRGGLNTTAVHGGFASVEEQLGYQRDLLKLLRHNVDSLKRALTGQEERTDSLERRVQCIADSTLGATREARLREFVLERLVMLTTLFEQENFNAERIESTTAEIERYGDLAVPVLREIALDNKLERKVHSQAVAVLGDIGTRKAADAVLDILAQTQDSEVKIEGLIAIGKIKDRRASYLIEHLASDPDGAVAFVAAEVLQKIENRSPDKDTASAARVISFPSSIPESKIPAVPPGKQHAQPLGTSAPGAENSDPVKTPERGTKKGSDTARAPSRIAPPPRVSSATAPNASSGKPAASRANSTPAILHAPAAAPPRAVSDSANGRNVAAQPRVPAPSPNPEKGATAAKPRPPIIDTPVRDTAEKDQSRQKQSDDSWDEDSW